MLLRVTVVRAAEPSKALFPMLVTLAGIVTDPKPAQLNAKLPMVSKDEFDGMVKEVMEQ